LSSLSCSRSGFRPCSQYLRANTHKHIPVFRVKYPTLFHHALTDWFLWHWKDRLRRCQWKETKFTVSKCWEHNNTEYYHTRNHHNTYCIQTLLLSLLPPLSLTLAWRSERNSSSVQYVTMLDPNLDKPSADDDTSAFCPEFISQIAQRRCKPILPM